MHYRRVCIKLSGEVFGGKEGFGFDHAVIDSLSKQIKRIHESGAEIGLIVGGGNIFRGTRSAPEGMDRVAADHMGMLATVINAILLQDALERNGLATRLLTAIEMRAIAEPYIKRRMVRHIEKRRVVIFAAGTGNPFFTTDTAAALRASEMAADVLIKGTKVDGVYDKDPAQYPDAERFDRLSYQEVLSRDLKVMDATAIAFCKDNSIPILVLNIERENTLYDAVMGETVGTIIA